MSSFKEFKLAQANSDEEALQDTTRRPPEPNTIAEESSENANASDQDVDWHMALQTSIVGLGVETIFSESIVEARKASQRQKQDLAHLTDSLAEGCLKNSAAIKPCILSEPLPVKEMPSETLFGPGYGLQHTRRTPSRREEVGQKTAKRSEHATTSLIDALQYTTEPRASKKAKPSP